MITGRSRLRRGCTIGCWRISGWRRCCGGRGITISMFLRRGRSLWGGVRWGGVSRGWGVVVVGGVVWGGGGVGGGVVGGGLGGVGVGGGGGGGGGSCVVGPAMPNGSIHPSADTLKAGNGGYLMGQEVVGF